MQLRLAIALLSGLFLGIPLNARVGFSQAPQDKNTVIDFGLQIRPILSEHCFHCHGPDPAHREADLRLDEEASAKQDRSGHAAITERSSAKSELIRRILSSDPDEVMPPPSSRKTLSETQKKLLGAWIDQGASWGPHWALAPPKQLPIPKSEDPWAKHPIDAWVLKGIQDHGLVQAPPADNHVLVRRMYLDVLGLPPDPRRLERFIEEASKDRSAAIQNLVDDLLSHPGFGEHWGRLWLDLARYADTKGYEKDLKRDMWPYRDWVIESLNEDMPYDRFTIEQLAGDLLDNPSSSQRIATAFHRATLSNDEGGTDDEEYRVAAVKDRVDTTLQVWMGLTMGCAKCHTHKYDPITIEDYYRFYAIFNQTEDADRYDDEPRMVLPTFAQQEKLGAIQLVRQQAAQEIEQTRAEKETEILSRWKTAKPAIAQADSKAELIIEEDLSVRAVADRPATDTYELTLELPAGTYGFFKLEALMAKAKPEDAAPKLGLNPSDPNFVINELQLSVDDYEGTTNSDAATIRKRVALIPVKASFEQTGWSLAGAVDDDPKTGWAVAPKLNQNHWCIVRAETPVVINGSQKIRLRIVQNFGGHLLLHRVRVSVARDDSTPLLVDDHPDVQRSARRLKELDGEINSIKEQVAKLPILKELAPSARRTTRLHKRGSFLDPGDTVSPALIPLFSTQESNAEPDRLSAARWIVDPKNPLTPRVAVNRVWAQLFGRGLVETEEDFGSQGAMPTHPELLDWLAVEYRDGTGWSLKQLLKTILLTNTYQQAYVQDETRASMDPRNLWLSRGTHFRLSAEVVRDQALGVAGLLSSKRGGPPVMPPQPAGLWRSTYSTARWITSPGEDRFRRGIYTYWKRTTPYPSMEVFDAPTREVCQVRRIATNTPLQALVTLNDPVYVEASIAMSIRWLGSSRSDQERLRQGVFQTLSRPVEADELTRLEALLQRARAYYAERPDDAKAYLSDYPIPIDSSLDSKEVAAWAVVSSTLLNLDEFLTRP